MVRKTRNKHETQDFDETKQHIFAAGRELLCAAKGALTYCREYVETSIPKESQTDLISFFQKAITVADELGKSISGVTDIRNKAEEIAKPIFEAISNEMKCEKQSHTKVKKPKTYRARRAGKEK